MSLKNFTKRLKLFAIWISQGKYHLLTIASYILAGLYLFGFLQFYPSTVALFMTLTGLIVIMTQQIIDAKEFDLQKPNTFTGWIKSFSTVKPFVSSGVSSISTSIFGKGHVTASISSHAKVEEKVEFLLQQIAALDSMIAKVDDRVDEVESSLKITKKDFQTSIKTLSKNLNNIIGGHVVGSYDVSLFGISFTICGTVIQFFCA